MIVMEMPPTDPCPDLTAASLNWLVPDALASTTRPHHCSYAEVAMSTDKNLGYNQRLRLVQHAITNGIKDTCRVFSCNRRTVRKWLRRYHAANGARHSLMEQSRRPHSCPHQTPKELADAVIAARRIAPCHGPRMHKTHYHLQPGISTIARILRQQGLAKPPRKKHGTLDHLR